MQDEIKQKLAYIPTVKYFILTYANSIGDNDQKAAEAFKRFEPHERLRRLQSELTCIRDHNVIEKACKEVIGKKRFIKFQGYDKWAQFMLLWLVLGKK